jgi:hypothetical protein
MTNQAAWFSFSVPSIENENQASLCALYELGERLQAFGSVLKRK